MRWAVWFDTVPFDRLRTGLRRTPNRLTTNGSSASARFGTGSRRMGGWVRGGLRAEEAGLKPAPTQEGRGGGGKTGGRLGCCRLCGSTRSAGDGDPAHHERGWAADEGCAEDGRVGDGGRTKEGEDGGLGLVASSGGWFDTGRRVRTPGSPRTVAPRPTGSEPAHHERARLWTVWVTRVGLSWLLTVAWPMVVGRTQRMTPFWTFLSRSMASRIWAGAMLV